ncbi:MAG: type II toxin-antitoxin system RelE/ParE family toxin [Bacteroidia bacterium]
MTRRAENDLEVIYEFLLMQHSPQTAGRILLGIIQRIDQLAMFPYAGKIDPNALATSPLVRYKISGKYKICYRLLEGRVVEVTRILDTRKAPPTIIA